MILSQLKIIDFSIIITLHLVKVYMSSYAFKLLFLFQLAPVWTLKATRRSKSGERISLEKFSFSKRRPKQFPKTEINLTSTCGNICNITNISHFVKNIPRELFSNLKENSAEDYLMIIAQTDWCCNLLYLLHDIKGASMILPPVFVWYRLYRY